MAVGTLAPVAIQQFFDANGDPLAGGFLEWFLAGTTTPSPVYADPGLTTPLSNPVVLDGGGRAPQMFLAALSYKQVLRDRQGVVIWTADHIVPPAAVIPALAQIADSGLLHDVLIPESSHVSVIEFRNSAILKIDGFRGGTPGQFLVLRNTGESFVELLPDSMSGSAQQNRLLNHLQTGPTVLQMKSGRALYMYQPNGWMLLSYLV